MTLIGKKLQKGHSSYRKYHLRKMAPSIMAPHKKGISQKRYLTKMASNNLHYWFSEVLPTPC